MMNDIIKYCILFLIILFVGLELQAQENEIKKDSLNVANDSIVDLKKAKKYLLGGISVKGNDRYTEQSIKAFSGLTEGTEIKIPGDKLSSAIKKLWESDLFNNVDVYAIKIDGKAIYLEFEVQELSKISRVKVVGVKKNRAEELQKETEFKKGSMLTENLITTTKNYIKKKYTDKGFLKTKVNIDYKIDTASNGEYAVLINIDRGERVKIKNLRFHGNNALKEKKLKKLLKKTKQKNLFHIFKPSKYREKEYNEDLERLISKYQEKGYRDAQIVSDSISWNDDNTINLDITLSEGNQYHFGDIKFLGNTVFTDNQLSKFLGLYKGDTYNGKLLNERISGNGKPDSQDIANTYLNRGYLFSNVTPVETGVKKDTISIEIRIHEDDPATIKRIQVFGNEKTNDHVVYRELRTVPGKLFSREDIIRSIREISQLGFFDAEAVTPDVKPNYADKTVDIDYNVAEKGSSQIELQGGFGGNTFIGTLGLSFNNFSVKNLFNKKAYRPVPMGDGQKVALRFQISKFSSTYSLSFTEPWLGGKRPRALSFSIYNSTQYRFDFTNNDVNRDNKLGIIGASVGINQRLRWPDDYFGLSTTLNYQRYNLQNFFLSSFGFNNGISNNLALSVNFSRNSSGPNPIYPTSGSQFNIGGKFTPPYSLFDDKDYSSLTDKEKFKWLEFYKLNFSGRWYNRLYGDLVLVSKAEFGALGAYNNELGISPFERFYVGGDGLGSGQFDGRQTIGLRGYPNASLSSQRGGTLFNKFSFETRYPITLKPAASIYVLGFLEGGNSFENIDKFDIFNLKRSAGFGLRIFMPAFGLLGIDFGHGFDDIPGVPGEKAGWDVHFIINQQF